ncbi:hypothetical protein FZEAL_272 [Fusarium zealandicum]|uniref:galacturonan 1,4-alpha-galacturonidase n=1 Tax=Fusarium zealandicum TaxID=1053134 RepID=A0A8H4UVS5_9HYPO|nr:hypothetical protein FZEAL_272 [Fusarium zealandicum]
MRLSLLALALATFSTSQSSPTSDDVHITKRAGRRTCTVYARGKERSDVDRIVYAFDKCRKNADIIFPQGQTYWIDKKIHANLRDVTIDWRGEWLFSKNTTYWRQNSYYIAFQNHRAGFMISGNDIHIDGHMSGGINGNGDVWYDQDKGKSTEGRPMFWSLNIMNGTNLAFENITCSAFSNNAPSGRNWVQNADGFNTMDARNVTLKNFTYRGGDDCIAIKPRSYGIKIDNIICEGGNGVAIGSLGQYLEDNTVEDVVISNAKMIRYGWDMSWSVYIKTWMGHLVSQGDSYESAGQPRGGGWGKVRNLRFSNFELENVSRGPYITQNNGNNGSFSGTSKMEISNIVFENFTGNLLSPTRSLGEISCSIDNPCFDITFKDMDKLESGPGKCKWYKKGSILGLPGC